MLKTFLLSQLLRRKRKSLTHERRSGYGEMEVSNLLISKHPEIVEKLLKTYATNEELREQTIMQLLNPGKTSSGHNINSLNMDLDVDLKNNKSVSREILDKYLNVLGYSIIDNCDNLGGNNG